MHLGPLPLCNTGYNHNPKDPDSAGYDAVRDYGTRALSSQGQAEKTVNDSSGDGDAPEPDVHVRIKRDILIAFVLKVVDVAEDGLKDKKHDDGYAENRVQRGELNHRVSGVPDSRVFSHAHVGRALSCNVDTESESNDRTHVREGLHSGMNADEAPKRRKSDEEGSKGKADDKCEAHDHAMDGNSGTIVTSARVASIDDLRIRRVQERVGRTAW